MTKSEGMTKLALLAPNHPGERLALDIARVGVGEVALQLYVKLIGFAPVLLKDGVEVVKVGQASSLSPMFSVARRFRLSLLPRQAGSLSHFGQSQSNALRAARRYRPHRWLSGKNRSNIHRAAVRPSCYALARERNTS